MRKKPWQRLITMARSLVLGKKVSRSRRHYVLYLLSIPFLHFLLFPASQTPHVPRFRSPPWTIPLPIPEPREPSSALLTPIPEKLPDGLGHRIAVVNFEHRLARTLSVRYIHRVSRYASLTRVDPLAVDRFFGWSVISDNRDRLLEKNCVVERRTTEKCLYTTDFPMCKSLKSGSEFERLVNIPPELVDCIPRKQPEICGKMEAWASQFGPRTLFQMVPSLCHEDYRVGSFEQTRTWFRNMYWGLHGVSNELDDITKPEVSKLNDKRLQIAVHIRRGDFLNVTLREVIADKTYADLICNAKSVVDEAFGADVPTDVHIFSEGVPPTSNLYSHDVDLMEKMYITDKGIAVEPEKHWERVMQCNGDISVKTHIATDTMKSLHDMIAADMFIGSHSGMSAHIVNVIARGVRIMPKLQGQRKPSPEWAMEYDYDKESGISILNRTKLSRMVIEMKRDGQLRGIVTRRR